MECAQINEIPAVIERLAARTKLVASTLESELHIPISPFDFEAADDALTRSRQGLRQYRNSQLPVMQLPEEIMVTIFRLVRASLGRVTKDALGLVIWWSYSLKWTTVTRVCHAWRKAAIACPDLWTQLHVYNRKVDKTEKTLRYSGSLPLSVQVTSSDRPPIVDILEQMHRLKRLRLVGSVSEEEKVLLASKAAPLIRSYEIHETPTSATTDPLVLPVLFGGVHPRLSSLAFCGFTRYGTNDLSALKRLCMGHQTYRSTDDFAALLDLLQGLPQLQDLMFYGSLPIEEELDLNPTHRSVPLPCLRRVIFATLGISLAGRILSGISLPDDQSLAVIYSPKEPRSLWQPEQEDVDTGIASKLHMLGEFWNNLAANAEMVDIDTKTPRWLVAIIGCQGRRELRLVEFSDGTNGMLGAFEGVMARAQSVWVHVRHSYRSENEKPLKQATRSLLMRATTATNVYLDVEEVDQYSNRKWEILDFRPNSPPPNVENWHLSIRPEENSWAGIVEVPEKFFRRLEGFKAGTFNFYTPLYEKCILETDDWKAALEDAAPEVKQRVVEHEKAPIPGIPLSSACTAPCLFGWDMTSTHGHPFGSVLDSDSDVSDDSD